MVRQLLSLRSRRKLRVCCPLFFAGAVIGFYIVVFHALPTRFPAFAWPLNEPADDRRPRVFYRWIDETGRTLNGTKPPVYGLFLLLDLNSSSYMTSRQGDDTAIERLIDRDVGFSSCHQVPQALSFPSCNYNRHNIMLRSLAGGSQKENMLPQWLVRPRVRVS